MNFRTDSSGEDADSVITLSRQQYLQFPYGFLSKETFLLHSLFIMPAFLFEKVDGVFPSPLFVILDQIKLFLCVF